MEFNFSTDIKLIRNFENLSQEELADILDIEQNRIASYEANKIYPSKQLLENFYSYAYKKDIHLNKLKEMNYLENISSNHKLLFHGAKDEITSNIDIYHSRFNNDFGNGFYARESYTQSASFVSAFESSIVYILDFDTSNLIYHQYNVDTDWMMTIAYYRETLNEYEQTEYIQKLVKESSICDYIIAPIADNRMFRIINSYISGEITDEQCKHALAAINLGYQYVFKTDKAVKQIKIVEKLYLSKEEKKQFSKRKNRFFKTR